MHAEQPWNGGAHLCWWGFPLVLTHGDAEGKQLQGAELLARSHPPAHGNRVGKDRAIAGWEGFQKHSLAAGPLPPAERAPSTDWYQPTEPMGQAPQDYHQGRMLSAKGL